MPTLVPGPDERRLVMAHVLWRYRLRALFIVLSVLALHAVVATGDVNEIEKASLKGVNSVRVLVEISDQSQQMGLTPEQYHNDIELRLRQAGITVLTEEEHKHRPLVPFLILRVATVEVDGTYAYGISFNLLDKVRPLRNPNSTLIGFTWEAPSRIGVVGSQSVGTIRNEIGDMVGEFLNAYLAANPHVGH